MFRSKSSTPELPKRLEPRAAAVTTIGAGPATAATASGTDSAIQSAAAARARVESDTSARLARDAGYSASSRGRRSRFGANVKGDSSTVTSTAARTYRRPHAAHESVRVCQPAATSGVRANTGRTRNLIA